MRNQFGPWTTELNAAPGARLSTFWKRRMAMLPAVASSHRPPWSLAAGLVLCIAAIGAVPLVRGEPADVAAEPSDLDPRLEGTWLLIVGHDGGNCIENNMLIEFRGGRAIIEENGDREVAAYKTDASRSLRTIDIIRPVRFDNHSRHALDDPQPNTLRGIYEFRERHLVLCLNEADRGERPTEFKSEPRADAVDLVLLTLAKTARIGAKGFSTDGRLRQISRPWTVVGRVTDPGGRPIADVEVRAATGLGTLLGGGSTNTGVDGKYELAFGPGIRILGETGAGYCQAALISARKRGFSTRNLGQNGDCVAALGDRSNAKIELSKLDTLGHPPERVFLPGEPKTINFVMGPAAKVAGRLVDAENEPLDGYLILLTGEKAPPGSSVLEQVRTATDGTFEIQDVTPQYEFQFLIEAPSGEKTRQAWASLPMQFIIPGDGEFRALTRSGNVRSEFAAKEFEIQLYGDGMNWRDALARTAQQKRLHYRAENAQLGQQEDITIVKADKLRFVLGLAVPAESRLEE